MCAPGHVFRLLDGSVVYRIWLPITFHTLFATLIVILYWICDIRIHES